MLSNLANAAERAMSALGLLHRENFHLFNENDVLKKRDEKDAGVSRRERKRKNSTTKPWRGNKSREEEIEQANSEIQALRMRDCCSIF